MVRADEFPYDTPTGSRLESGDYGKCLQAALEVQIKIRRIDTDEGVGRIREQAAA